MQVLFPAPIRDRAEEVITFLNLGKIKIGYPGHFYVKPFFIK